MYWNLKWLSYRANGLSIYTSLPFSVLRMRANNGRSHWQVESHEAQIIFAEHPERMSVNLTESSSLNASSSSSSSSAASGWLPKTNSCYHSYRNRLPIYVLLHYTFDTWYIWHILTQLNRFWFYIIFELLHDFYWSDILTDVFSHLQIRYL